MDLFAILTFLDHRRTYLYFIRTVIIWINKCAFVLHIACNFV